MEDRCPRCGKPYDVIVYSDIVFPPHCMVCYLTLVSPAHGILAALGAWDAFEALDKAITDRQEAGDE